MKLCFQSLYFLLLLFGLFLESGKHLFQVHLALDNQYHCHSFDRQTKNFVGRPCFYGSQFHRTSTEMLDKGKEMTQRCELFPSRGGTVESEDFPRSIVQLSSPCSHGRHELFKYGKLRFDIFCVPLRNRCGVALDHEAVSLVGKSLPDFFGDERHHGMEQPLESFERFDQRLPGSLGVSRVLALESRLDQLQVPVAVLMPDEVVYLARGLVEPIRLERCVDVPDRPIEAAKDPAISKGTVFRRGRFARAVEVHQNE